MEKVELTPEQLVVLDQKVEEILSNPENEKAKPEVYKEALDYRAKKQTNKSTPDPVLAEIQSRFGNGYTTKEDFYAEFEKHKSGAYVKEVLSTLPEPILNAIEKVGKNEPWEDAFSNVKPVDYNKNYTDEELVNLYYPNKFTEEELADAENVAAKAAKKNGRQAFLIEKQEKVNAKQLASVRNEQATKLARESLERTIANWKKNQVLLTPNIAADKLASMETRIRTELTTGSFYRKFVNSDGTYTDDAASYIYPLSFGTEFTGAWMERGKQAAEKDVHEIIDRGGQPREFNRGTLPPTPTDGRKIIDDIFGRERKNPYTLKSK